MTVALQIANAVEACCWIALVAACCAIASRRLETRAEELTLDAGLLLLALALRLAMTPGPANDWTPHTNLQFDFPVRYRGYMWVPFFNRLIGYSAGGGLPGVAAWNTALGLGSVLLFRRVVLALTGKRTVAAVAAALLAVTPLYVRLDTSDSVAPTVVFLWLLSLWDFALVERGERGWAVQVLALAAAAAGSLVRPDTVWLFLVVPVVGRPPAQWVRLWRAKWRFFGWAMGVGAGAILNLTVFHETTQVVSQLRLLDLVGMAGLLLVRLLFVYCPEPFGFFPLALAVLGWVFLVRTVRAGSWTRELTTYVCSVAAVSVPYLLKGPFFLESYTGSYNSAALLPAIAASAEGAGYLWPGLAQMAAPGKAATALAGIVLASGFLLPYRTAYPFQEEYRFLQQAIPPKTRATVLVYFDEQRPHDLDCCLYLPPPLFAAERPGLRWLTIGREALKNGVPDGLTFDYYYPGAIVSASPDLAGTGPARRTLSPGDVEATRAYIRERRRLDRDIRTRYPVRAVRRRNLRAEAFYQSVFPSNRMDVALYRALGSTEPVEGSPSALGTRWRFVLGFGAAAAALSVWLTRTRRSLRP